MKQYITDLTAFVRVIKKSANAQPLRKQQESEDEFELIIPESDPGQQIIIHAN